MLLKGGRHLWADALCFNVIDLDSNHFRNGENTTQARRSGERERKSEFIERVNRFLQLIQVPLLKKLKVQYNLGAKAASELDQWLSIAFDKGVEEIVVDLKQIDYQIKDVKKYTCFLYIFLRLFVAVIEVQYHWRVCIILVAPRSRASHVQWLQWPLIYNSWHGWSRPNPNGMFDQQAVQIPWKVDIVVYSGGAKIDGSSSSAPQLSFKCIECKSCHDLEKISIHGAAQLDTFVYIGKSVDSSFLDLTMLEDVFIFYKPDFVEDGKSDGNHDGCKHIPRRYQLRTLTLSTSIAQFQVKLSKLFLY